MSRDLKEVSKSTVEARDARLVVIFIPSKREIYGLGDSPPYQRDIIGECVTLGNERFNLASALKNYRYGIHWDSKGHQVAARAMEEYLHEQLDAVESRHSK